MFMLDRTTLDSGNSVPKKMHTSPEGIPHLTHVDSSRDGSTGIGEALTRGVPDPGNASQVC